MQPAGAVPKAAQATKATPSRSEHTGAAAPLKRTPAASPSVPTTGPLTSGPNEHGPGRTHVAVREAVVVAFETSVKAADYMGEAAEFIEASSDALSPFVSALQDAAPVLASAWEVTSSLLEAIADAPMVGPAVKLLLLFAKAIEAVAGYESLVERAKQKIGDFAQALKDIDGMTLQGSQPSPTLSAWVRNLRDALEAATRDSAAALRAAERPSFVMRLLCAVKGAVFDADRVSAALIDLDTHWLALGPALTIQVGWTLVAASAQEAQAQAQLLPQLRSLVQEAALAGAAAGATALPRCLPPSLRAPGLRPAEVALRADLLREATLPRHAVAPMDPQLALIAVLIGGGGGGRGGGGGASAAPDAPSALAAAAAAQKQQQQLRACRLATQCWATSAALEAARDPARPPPPLLVHVDVGAAAAAVPPGTGGAAASAAVSAISALAAALAAAADAAGLPATPPRPDGKSDSDSLLALAVSRLPRPARGRRSLAWAVVVSGVPAPSPVLDELLRVSLPLLGAAAVPEAAAAPKSLAQEDPAEDASASPAPLCCAFVIQVALAQGQEEGAPPLPLDDGPAAPIVLEPLRAAAQAAGVPLASALRGSWLEGAGGSAAARFRGILMEDLPLLRLLAALRAAASPDPAGPAARCAAAIPDLSGLVARCAVAARNAAAAYAGALVLSPRERSGPPIAELPSCSWVGGAADAAERLAAAIAQCGAPPKTADLRSVVVAATGLFDAVAGAEVGEAQPPLLWRHAWLPPAVPAQLFVEAAALAAEQEAAQGERHEASMAAVRSVAAAVVATMDAIISPEDVSSRLAARNLTLAALQSFVPGADAADADAADVGPAAATVLTAPAVPLTLWRYSERAAEAARRLARGDAAAAAAASSSSDPTSCPSRLLSNPSDAEAEVQGDTTTAAQAIVSSKELCVITGACALVSKCVVSRASPCATLPIRPPLLLRVCRHRGVGQDVAPPDRRLLARSRQEPPRREPPSCCPA